MTDVIACRDVKTCAYARGTWEYTATTPIFAYRAMPAPENELPGLCSGFFMQIPKATSKTYDFCPIVEWGTKHKLSHLCGVWYEVRRIDDIGNTNL